MSIRLWPLALVLALTAAVPACTSPNSTGNGIISAPTISQDPNTAEVVEVDRFADQAGTFFRRSANPNLPAPGAPIDLDQAPFRLTALLPDGNRVPFYHLDVRSTSPANLYIFFKSDGSPLSDQLYVFDALPGEPGYSDFCAIQRVIVPDNYVVNSITSRRDLEARVGDGFRIEATGKILNMPVVPAQSSANQSSSGGKALLLQGWCRNKVLYYFAFEELQATPQGLVPTASMFAFFDEPGLPHRGGFRTLDDEGNTKNVLAVAPGAPGYSPLWAMQRLSGDDWINVNNLTDVQTTLKNPAVPYGATVNAVMVK